MSNTNSIEGKWRATGEDGTSLDIELTTKNDCFTISFVWRTKGLIEQTGKLVKAEKHTDLVFDQPNKSGLTSGSYCPVADTLSLACETQTCETRECGKSATKFYRVPAIA